MLGQILRFVYLLFDQIFPDQNQDTFLKKLKAVFVLAQLSKLLNPALIPCMGGRVLIAVSC